MAQDTAHGITWLLELRQADVAHLGALRHWTHLRMATEGEAVWVKGFGADEVNDVVVQSLPSKKVWWSRDNLLFPHGSILPARKAPALLWVSIERGLPVTLPPLNHNYFGVTEGVEISLVASNEERTAAALVVDLHTLRGYILTAPAVRLQALTWTIIDGRQALIRGTPLLPIPGTTLWSDGGFLMPAGYDFAWPQLTATLRGELTAGSLDTILWWVDGAYSRLPAEVFRPLSIASFRQSTAAIFRYEAPVP